MSFEFRNLNRLGNQVAISIPTDDAGYLGRECPETQCEGYFKIRPGTGLLGANLPCICPYCGHQDSTDRFWTKEQVEFANSIAFRNISEAICKDLKQLEFEQKPSGAFGIGISLKVKAGVSLPIRCYREKELETHVTCEQCTLQYAVYGVFAYCPDCGAHNSLQILQNNLDLTGKQLALAETLSEPELRQHLIDDALENCVSAFDGFARETCRVRAAKSNNPTKCENLSFQNLPRATLRLQNLFGVDLASAIQPSDWHATHVAFMRRHLLAHKAGVIDQQYIDETTEPPELLGRKVAVSSSEVRALADIVTAIARYLVAALPVPK